MSALSYPFIGMYNAGAAVVLQLQEENFKMKK